ncbi:pyrroline-5-carboxylate reductase [Desertibacillus haloalkaliphilus]|uniref:pyrroline-5-carboxylate reductase n=1 Tax=Desertibacillus haloalkaliphilus TaxID=1328930 RepID=UPI001C25741F|nr:pyrroline-5-carboxylate reductase [Desertibacillus haloalkaliphilus]MBU8908895.1 pyrroline-5-carboxylate reductase [Desertibacillus haloalkaliphilus]
MKKQRLLFIGAGRMGEAIFSQLIKDPHNFAEITISNQSNHERLAFMRETYGISTTENWKDVVAKVDVIVLAIPPHAHKEVLTDLHDVISDQLVITVAAGIGIDLLEQHLPERTAVAWVMPNTAADVGESMSIYTLGRHVTSSQRSTLQTILSTIGAYEECTEEQVHQLTAITGSAPAFLYYFSEALEEAARRYGVSQDQARKLVSQMILGSAIMMKKGNDPAQLRDQVTSPGGATAAGINVLKDNNVKEILHSAVQATNARAKEQGKQ